MSQYGTGYSASDTDGSGSEYASLDSRDDYASTSVNSTAASTAASYGVSTGASRGGAPVVSFENVSKHYGRLRMFLLRRAGDAKGPAVLGDIDRAGKA